MLTLSLSSVVEYYIDSNVCSTEEACLQEFLEIYHDTIIGKTNNHNHWRSKTTNNHIQCERENADDVTEIVIPAMKLYTPYIKEYTCVYRMSIFFRNFPSRKLLFSCFRVKIWL